MLFNSFFFVFLFLPISLILFYSLTKKIHKQIFLIIASFLFISIWNLYDALLLIGSIIFNYSFGYFLIKTKKKSLLTTSIIINILFLAYFKYNFFELYIFNENYRSVDTIILPLAISFYTFEQIIYLVETYKNNKKTNYPLLDYLLFVLFFPRLISGPIYYFNEYLPKLNEMLRKKANLEYINKGMVIFFFALFKKIFIADYAGLLSDTFFKDPLHFNMIDSWLSTLFFTMQIYFDFSAYSEMALGIGLMFGILLPLNFNSPYKSKSITSFWQNWHMSLSRVIKDYLYIPLGGNKKGLNRQLINLLIAMSIAGVWHGSGITFLLWGFGHGFFLCVNHLYRRTTKLQLPKIISVLITFLSVHFLWILFRSENLEKAKLVYSKLVLWDGSHTSLSSENIYMLSTMIVICFFMPNINELFLNNKNKIYTYKTNVLWLFATLFCFTTSFLYMNKISQFLYFNF
jgi:alginate O-acetyltransferase complex protein AlgI